MNSNSPSENVNTIDVNAAVNPMHANGNVRTFFLSKIINKGMARPINEGSSRNKITLHPILYFSWRSPPKPLPVPDSQPSTDPTWNALKYLNDKNQITARIANDIRIAFLISIFLASKVKMTCAAYLSFVKESFPFL
ncbi:MAG: hypothetical protein ACRC4M_01290 [Mycoplasma sp.]